MRVFSVSNSILLWTKIHSSAHNIREKGQPLTALRAYNRIMRGGFRMMYACIFFISSSISERIISHSWMSSYWSLTCSQSKNNRSNLIANRNKIDPWNRTTRNALIIRSSRDYSPMVLIPLSCCATMAVQAQIRALRDLGSLITWPNRWWGFVFEIWYDAFRLALSVGGSTSDILLSLIRVSMSFRANFVRLFCCAFMNWSSASSWKWADTRSRAARREATGAGRRCVNDSSAFAYLSSELIIGGGGWEREIGRW